MICVLVGITPPKKELWESIQQNVTSIHNVRVKWRNTFSLVPDEDNDGALTLLMAASIYNDNYDDDDRSMDMCGGDNFDPQNVISAVNDHLTAKVEQEQFSSEMWASAPAPLPLKPSHMSIDGDDEKDKDMQSGFVPIARAFEIEHNPEYDGEVIDVDEMKVQRAGRIMKEWGMVMQQKVLTSSQIQELRTIVDSAIEDAEHSISIHRPDIAVGKDSMCFKEIGSRGLGRFDLRLTSSIAMDFVKRAILSQNSFIVSFLQSILSTEEDLTDIDYDVSVVYSRPGANAQGWHADAKHQKGADDAGWEDDGWKTKLANSYAFCVFIPLIDLDDETGFTQFWPGSHRSRNFIGFGKVAEVTKATFDAKGPAGCGIWYDYRLLHRGMPNTSNLLRPVVQIVFKKKWYVERANYGSESIARDNLKDGIASSSNDTES